MKTPVTIYDRTTGEVRSIRRVDVGPFQLRPGEAFVEGVTDASRQYIEPESGAVVDMPAMDIVIAGNVLSGIPAGSSAIVNLRRHPEPVDDGTFEIEVEHPQTVHIVLQHPLWLAWHGEVPCVPD